MLYKLFFVLTKPYLVLRYVFIYIFKMQYMKSSKGLRNFLILPVCLLLFSAIPVYAQDAQLLDVTIDQAKGDIEMMLPGTFDWIPIPEESGNTFSEGTQIRTGPFSSATLVLAESSVILVDSLAYFTVEQFFRSGNVVTTRINLIIGSITSTLNDETKFENDYKIITPSLTETLNSGEIKKVVSGAMYNDSVRTGPRKGADVGSEETDGYKKGPSAGERTRANAQKRESSTVQGN